MPTVEVEGAQLAYRVDGHGPVLVLCGAAVAFKLAQATLQEGKRRGLQNFTAIPDGWEMAEQASSEALPAKVAEAQAWPPASSAVHEAGRPA